jgi:hypothetical protein
LSACGLRCKSLYNKWLEHRAEDAQPLTGLLCAPSRKLGDF